MKSSLRGQKNSPSLGAAYGPGMPHDYIKEAENQLGI